MNAQKVWRQWGSAGVVLAALASPSGAAVPAYPAGDGLSRVSVTIEDDMSFPQDGDWDYGLGAADIEFSNDAPAPGDTVTITAHVHNYGLARADSAWGWYSSTGRSCWGEWDFNYPASGTVDIAYRCRDDVTVNWRVELDGVHLASPAVPGVGTGKQWKIVTLHDVAITAGPHTVFLGTYQMDYYPDYAVDWVQIGDLRIQAEDYDRMGGNDPNPDWRGLTIWPREVIVQIWEGATLTRSTKLFEGPVGDTNTVIDAGHQFPGNTWVAHYVPDGGEAIVEIQWTPAAAGTYEIRVVVDPANGLTETNEQNNIAYVNIEVGAPPQFLGTADSIGDVCDLELASGDVEPRAGGIRQLDFHFDGQVPAGVTSTLAWDNTCPGPASFVPYTGAAIMACTPDGDDLECTFTPALEDQATYQFDLSGITGNPPGTDLFVVSALVGDVDGNKKVNKADRKVVRMYVGTSDCWIDIDEDGTVTRKDARAVKNNWGHCAP